MFKSDHVYNHVSIITCMYMSGLVYNVNARIQFLLLIMSANTNCPNTNCHL